MTTLLIAIIIFLLLVVISLIVSIRNRNNQKSSALFINYNKFKVDPKLVQEVEKAVEENGIWRHRYEWRLMQETELKIEPKVINNRTYYLVNVECSSSTQFTAYSIERALLFMKIYETLEMDFYYTIGWPSSEGLISKYK
jgi:hypothetical protein